MHFSFCKDEPLLGTMVTNYSSLSAFSAGTQLIALLFLCLLLPLPSPAYGQNRSDEVSTLRDFAAQNFEYVTENGVNWTQGGHWIPWNYSDENACGWIGIACTINSTVAELELSGWGIVARNLEPLSRLRDLYHLDLSFNFLGTVGLPSDLGKLVKLTWLDLSNNDIVGHIPDSISECKSLRFLNLGQNSFEGEIPFTLSNLVDLQVLLVSNNKLYGQFPAQLTELSSLNSIDLSYNNFNGSIPALPKLTKLANLNLDNNSFTKFEESWFSSVAQSLQILSVSFNQLEDVLPSQITIQDLQIFNLTGNRLSGHIPWFSNPSLYGFAVDLSQNNLSGEIPANLFNTSFVCNYLNLSYNVLTGNVPFSGTYGNCFTLLDLSHNNLSGLIPSNIFELTRIQILWLGNNQLSGDVVDILNNNRLFSFLTDLRLENNVFTGDISKLTRSAVDFLVKVEVLDFSDNHLQWSVSAGIPDPIATTLEMLTSGVDSLTEFRAAGNNFAGTSLPTTCFTTSGGLRVLDLSGSHLNGEISTEAFQESCLASLQFLNLSNNEIVGIVPESIVALPYLEVLDLSNNKLSGHLPLLMSQTSLNNPSLFEGNHGLCGYPLSLCAQPSIKWWVLLCIIGGSIIIALGSCTIATWRWRVYHRRHQQDADLIRTLLERDSATLMPLRELKKATENFAESAQIGEGGFGTVYVGKLNNGTMVAIKKSKREGSMKDKEQFLNEVRILSYVNHRYLVKLLGCCMENKIALLVFEYIPNGTLQEHLCGKVGGDFLTWKQRLKIAMQTADALNYLHSAAIFPIYHRDVKSANILIDDNFNAKVADLGISKLAPLQATHVSTKAIQGTLGYIDPEYYSTCQLTDKSDVYSFGVVLLELISAKPALDFQRGGDKTNLVYFASHYIERGDLKELIDPTLRDTYYDVVGNGRKSITDFSNLAIKCLDKQSRARPCMNEVLKELQVLWTELEGKATYLEDPLKKDEIEDLHRDYRALISEASSENSSTSFAMQIDGGSI